VFLRVRLAHVRGGVGCDPEVGLGNRLYFEQVEREAGAFVLETRAHGAAGIVEIDGGRAEPADGLSLSKIGIGNRRLLRESRHGQEENEYAMHDAVCQNIMGKSRGTADLHDDIGAGLSQIAILSEVLIRRSGGDLGPSGPLSGMAGSARELLASMSDLERRQDWFGIRCPGPNGATEADLRLWALKGVRTGFDSAARWPSVPLRRVGHSLTAARGRYPTIRRRHAERNDRVNLGD